jgi:hypothetical protein
MEPLFIAAIAQGKSVREASQAAGFSARTGARRLRDARVQATVAELRHAVLDGMRDRLLAGASEAIDRLLELSRCDIPQVALGACKELLHHALPRKLELNVSNTAPSEQRLSSADLHDLFTRLATGGFLTDPDSAAAYAAYLEALAEAEKDPLFSIVSADFMPQAPAAERLEAWQRRQFPVLATAEFAMLRILRDVLASTPQAVDGELQ